MQRLAPAPELGDLRRRVIASLCAIALGLGLGLTPWGVTPASASTVTATDANGLVYEADSANAAAGAAIIGYTGTSKSVTIPAVVEIGDDTYDVTAIGVQALKNRGLTSLTFDTPSNIVTIDEEAFSNNLLTTLAIPSSVETIDRCAFFINRLVTVTFAAPSSLTSIGDCALRTNLLTAVTIPSTVGVIGAYAFANNDFISINFETPSALTEIGDYAFYEFSRGNNSVAELVIPHSVVSIGTHAFFRNETRQLTFASPSNVISIGSMAFAEHLFTAVTLPASLESVGTSAFRDGSLESVSFESPSRLSSISERMFYSSPLRAIDIPDSVTVISASAFTSTELSAVTLPASLVSIGDEAFAFSRLTEVTIPETVSSIGAYAFDGNNGLRDVTFRGNRPQTISTMRPFGRVGSANVHIPCGATGFTYPLWLNSYHISSVCEVGFSANGGVGTMEPTNVATGDRLPVSLFSRDDFQFSGWRTSSGGTGALIADEQPATFITPTTLHAQWIAATDPECVTYEVSGATASVIDYDPVCGGADVVLPGSTSIDGISYPVTSIGPGAFEGASITKVSIPYGVASLGERAFFGNALTHVSIPASVVAIGSDALGGNAGLDRVDFAGAAPSDIGSTDIGAPLGPESVIIHYRAGAPGFSHPAWRGYSTQVIHELTFATNGGTGFMYPRWLSTSDALPAVEFTRSTYRFAGWNTAADGSGISVGDGAPSPFVADTTLYAQWVPDSDPPVLISPGVIVNANFFACTSEADRPAIPSTRPMLSVVATDPEGSNVHTIFTLTSLDGTVLWQSAPTLSASGQRSSAQVPAGVLPLDGVFRWRAQSYDNRMAYSQYSPWCEFRVDVTAPPPPTISPVEEGAMAVYPADTTAGGVGLTGVFQLAGGESSDAVRFRYSFNSDSLSNSILASSDGTANISFTPSSANQVTLYAAAVDQAGNQSTRVSYRFTVGVLRTVTFYANQGTGTMAPVVQSTPGALPLNTFTRPGYHFIGWNTSANGSGVAVPDGAVWPFTSNANLYAQWVQNAVASITINGPTSVVAQATESYTVEGFDEFNVSLGSVTNAVTLSGNGLTANGGMVTFSADPAATPGSMSSRTLTATLDSDPSITDALMIDVKTPSRNLDLLPDRIGGVDRYATGAAIAGVWGEYFDASIVFVATGENYPDALAGAAAAAHLNAPLILTPRSSIPASVMSRLNALRPDHIVVLGSSGAIAEGVVAALRTVTGSPTVSRIDGIDRYATAREIVKYAFSVNGNGDGAEERDLHTIVVATGGDFPDALSAAPAAASVGGAVILVDGSAHSIPVETMRLIRDLDPQRIIIAGAAGAVSSPIESQLRTSFGTQRVLRIAGADRFATSTAITRHFFEKSDAVFFAVGTDFPDALAGAALAGELEFPLIVTPSGCVPSATRLIVNQLDPTKKVLLGLSSVISNNVARLGVC